MPTTAMAMRTVVVGSSARFTPPVALEARNWMFSLMLFRMFWMV